VNPVNEQYPLILTSGRIRDQWHTMTRTGKVARLFGHYDEPFVEIHPADASEYGLEHGDLAQISSRWGNAVLRVQLTDSQQRGCLFVPMHWNRQFASQANIDAVVNPVTDPVSGEPEFKHTPVTICRYQADWYGLLLSRRRLVHNHAGYWASAMGDGFWRYYLAGETAVADWSQAARHLLCCEGDAINWQELSDAGRGVYRAARFQGDRMESCLFVGKDKQLPVHDWVQGLLQQESVTEQERRWILTGQPPGQMEDQGRIVCACFGVGEKMIQKAIIEQRITTLEQLGDMLNAGTNCGSCRPELQALLDACCNKQVAN
jgi:assimilatory nitrate reductase catalytic subunit